MWFTALIPLLSGIFGEKGAIGQYLKNKADTILAKQTLDTQIERDKLQFSRDLAQAAVESEKNKLAATGQGFKFVSFILITLPIVITCLFPEYGRRIFENLALIPVGFMQLWAAVVGVIWGLPIAANTMSAIFASIQEGWNARNQGKIEKIQAMATVVNETVLADSLRKTLFKEGMTQQQWDSISSAVRDATTHKEV